MTNIKQAISYFKYGVDCDIFQEPVTSYAKSAISALEKQIPKKAICKAENFTLCPNCNKRTVVHFKHCQSCGQALDWSDTE